ncbi:hypothetical protein [Streptomyces sp. NBC_01185]|uniref:hypothetical protein n=1 Tax=Streptomyces sp. NBC_01185 TaxID=2903764 RepID=UPI00386E4FC6|nr:hypothetical protein OG770_34530 [Streptomyces sp. NBC_01185]
MAAGEVLLWDADDKSTRTVPRLRRVGVMSGCLGFFGLLLLTDSDATWVLYAGALHLLAETGYWVWDRRRLVEARLVPGDADRPARLRLRRVGGRITEHDPHHVARVLLIHDNVQDLANLRLSLRDKHLLFGRLGRAPDLTLWRRTCPKAEVGDRAARWGMPGIPDE